VIGAHAAHVLGALVWLAVVALLASRGRFATPHGPAAGVRRSTAFRRRAVPVLSFLVYLI